MIFMDFVHENHIGRNFSMQNTLKPPVEMGSITPALEGAPVSDSHENRSQSVILPPPPTTEAHGEEDAPSKP